MAIKGRKFSKQHLANLRAAHAKRRGKKNKIIQGLKEATALAASSIGDKITMRNLPEYDPNSWQEVKSNGLIARMTQAIDKIETQIKRLETL